jgi:hypothetical protein
MMSRIAAGTRARKALSVVTTAFLAVSLTSLTPDRCHRRGPR